jgi:hypothetical protein
MRQSLITSIGLALFILSVGAQATSVPPPASSTSMTSKIGTINPQLALKSTVVCPPTIIAAATNAPQPWMPSAVTMQVVSAKLSDQPLPQQQMLCFYEGSGSKWYIGRNIQPEFKSCAAVNSSAFSCTK